MIDHSQITMEMSSISSPIPADIHDEKISNKTDNLIVNNAAMQLRKAAEKNHKDDIYNILNEFPECKDISDWVSIII